MNQKKGKRKHPSLTTLLSDELNDAKFSISKLRSTGTELRLEAYGGKSTPTTYELDTKRQLDANGLRNLHEEGQWRTNQMSSNHLLQLVAPSEKSRDRMRYFEEILEEYEVLSDGCVGHSLGGVLSGYHEGRRTHDAPDEEVGVCETAELWRYLVIDACLNTPRKTAAKLSKWAEGTHVGFETRLLLSGIRVAESSISSDGVTVEKLPDRSENMNCWLPVNSGIGLRDYLGRTIVRIPCTISPGLWKPRKVTKICSGLPTTSWEIPVEIKVGWALGKGSIEELCTAMSVACNAVIEAPMSWLDYGALAHFDELYGSAISKSGKGGPLRWSGNDSELTREMLRESMMLYRNIRDRQIDPEVKIAIKFWSNSKFEKLDFPERLIYLRIALEALLLGKNDRGELKFRLATHGAWYTGHNREERRDTYNTLKKFYDVASEAVHTGDVGKKRWKNAVELLKRSQEICRAVIKKRVKSKTKPNWDDIIFGG